MKAPRQLNPVPVLIFAGVLATGSAALAEGYRGGPAGKYSRPAMAARAHFSPGVLVRARTVGVSPDGTHALVVGRDRGGGLWNVEVNRASGRVTSALKQVSHSSLLDAKAFAARWEKIPAKLIRARPGDLSGRGLPVLSRSHKSLRIALPGTRSGTRPQNVLVGTKKSFLREWKSPEKNVRFDPADGIPSARRTLVR